MDAPYIQVLEAVASDASTAGGSYVYNSWGQHQPRITHHIDGSIRILYLGTDSQRNVIWRVMLRNPLGAWSQEAVGTSTDDVMLLRDPVSDKAHVIAWPSGVPTITTLPNAIPNVIPGPWGVFPSTARHYVASGISPDGTLCVKTSRELYIEQSTLRTSVQYQCGVYGQTWSWSAFVSHYIGQRFTYDYVFPRHDGISAAATSDLYKEVAAVPNLDPAYGNYVFNGIRAYSTGIDTDKTWWNRDIKLDAKARALDVKTPPALRLQDSLIDSQGRSFLAYFADDSTTPGVRGLYLSVSDKAGAVVFESKLNLPTYGYIRLYEDAKKRLWLLWSATGSQATQVYLYPVIESATPLSSGNSATFALGQYTDLSATFVPYVLYDNLYLAAPRGGNDKSLYIDAIFNACWSKFSTGIPFNPAQCYGADSSEHQRVFYVRMALPF